MESWNICWDITLEITKLVFWLLHHNVLFLRILVCCQSEKTSIGSPKKKGDQIWLSTKNLKSSFYMFGYTMKTKYINLAIPRPPPLTFGN